jgi:hypothetical protein
MIQSAKRAFDKNFFMEIMSITAWEIWKQRNNVIFRNESLAFLPLGKPASMTH